MIEEQEIRSGKAFWVGFIWGLPTLCYFFYHLIDGVSPVYDIPIVSLLAFVSSVFVGFVFQCLSWILSGIRQGTIGWKHLPVVIILPVILLAGFYYVESLSEEKKTAVEGFFKGIMNGINLVLLLVNLVLLIVSYLTLRVIKIGQNKDADPDGQT